MKMLVTGGAGFIGTNFIYYMQRKHVDLEIVCLDSLTYAGNIRNLYVARSHPGFRFVRGDITNWVAVDKLFQKEQFDYVVNFAAESHVDRSIENPGIFVTSNVIGVQILLDACRKHKIERFHQVSTDEVYGDLPLNRPDLLFTENTPLHASSPYSASKAGADLLALAYHRTFGMKVTISRCSNNYGPYQFPEKLIPKMIMLANKDRPLPVYGKGENVRDWLHADDHCQAIDLIISKGRPGEVYNVGGNNERRNIDIIRLILKEMGKDEEQIEFVTDRPGHDLRYAIDASKIRRELKWKPTFDFESGIKGTVRWYLDNIEWLNDVESGAYRLANDSV
jgi:dTDP-glucose 4,6-dehydratase